MTPQTSSSTQSIPLRGRVNLRPWKPAPFTGGISRDQLASWGSSTLLNESINREIITRRYLKLAVSDPNERAQTKSPTRQSRWLVNIGARETSMTRLRAGRSWIVSLRRSGCHWPRLGTKDRFACPSEGEGHFEHGARSKYNQKVPRSVLCDDPQNSWDPESWCLRLDC